MDTVEWQHLSFGLPTAELQEPHHPLAMATAYFSHVEEPQAFCLGGLVRFTETIQDEKRKARPPG